MAQANEPIASVQVDLIPTGDDADFRVKNQPGGEVHRKAAAEYMNSGFTIQADLAEVFHGSLTEQGKPATLIILDFRFLKTAAMRSTRRCRAVVIKLRFYDPLHPKGDRDPAILKIAPAGMHGFNSVLVTKEIKRMASLGLSSGLGIGDAVTLNSGIGWESTTNFEKTDKTVISGAITYDGNRVWGGKNVVRWAIHENDIIKDGVPGTIRTALLLERHKEGGQFLMETVVEAKVDMLYDTALVLQKVFGRVGKDEEITFDPEETVDTERVDVDCKNLGRWKLEDEVLIGSA